MLEVSRSLTTQKKLTQDQVSCLSLAAATLFGGSTASASPLKTPPAPTPPAYTNSFSTITFPSAGSFRVPSDLIDAHWPNFSINYREEFLKEKRTLSTLVKPETSLAKRFAISFLTCILAAPGYVISIYQGTPTSERNKSLINRFLGPRFPEIGYFPNNRSASTLMALNSTSLFFLGVLQAVKEGQTFVSSALSLSTVALFAVGGAAMWRNAIRYSGSNSTSLSDTDKRYMTIALAGIAVCAYATLAKIGSLPRTHLPVEAIAIIASLGVRSLSLRPFYEEYRKIAEAAALPNAAQNIGTIPSLVPLCLWTSAIFMSLFSLENVISVAAAVPAVMSLQNIVILLKGLLAHYRVGRARARAQPSLSQCSGY